MNRHRSHQHGGGGHQSRSTVEEDRIDIYNVQQQQLKQQQHHSSRPVKMGPPTKPKPNVALSRKSSKTYTISFQLPTWFWQYLAWLQKSDHKSGVDFIL